MSDEEIANTPIISMVGRFVSQKGVDKMSSAIKELYANWDKNFPGKNKPIFYIAGGDGEGGKQRKYVEDLKKSLPEEDNNRVIFMHGFAPMQAITAGSDFFMMPSNFEPCGLTQGESFALATPVIVSAVGGIVDTVNRNGKENGIFAENGLAFTPSDYSKAIAKGIDTFYNDKDKYNNMVADALAEDFTWCNTETGEGPTYDYLDLLGIDSAKYKPNKA